VCANSLYVARIFKTVLAKIDGAVECPILGRLLGMLIVIPWGDPLRTKHHGGYLLHDC
jgi:hypothetical protein